MSSQWEHFPHRADIGVRGIGATKAAAFENAARGLTAIITDLGRVAHKDCLRIECSAPDDELLLVDWLNALVYEMATRHMLFAEFKVNLHGDALAAVVCGEEVDTKRHEPAVEIKGATYTELKVSRDCQGRWIAQCVVDV